MSNFDFLKDFDETLYKLGNRIEKQVNTSPSGVKADATTFLEHILKKLLTKAGLKYNSRKPFTDQVNAVFRSELKMSNAYRERIINAYNYRNKIHDEFDDIEKHEFQDAIALHEKLFYIARKFYRDYNDDYDEYKGVPDFKPLEIDLSEDTIKHRDFNEIVDVKYDYCVVCGQPNHLNYSIYCHECSRKLDNSNNFISIRNAFGKDAEFTKEDLIEYGMQEGYVNQFLNSMVRENMLKAAGRKYSFNNMYLDSYLKRIDSYIAVGELITRFKEDKISPADIRRSREYVLGSRRQEPFYQFYKITKREIVKKFERDLVITSDIWESIDHTTITNEELKRWYNKSLGLYNKGQINESFVIFNQLLIQDYLNLKREGILEAEIRQKLNVSDDIYSFWLKFDDEFAANLKEIKIDLLTQALQDGKTREEIIEYAGVTSREYDDLVKVSNFNDNEFARIRNTEIQKRKENFVKYLENNDLESSCHLAKFRVEDFHEYYGRGRENSEYYAKVTQILMDKYLAQRRLSKTIEESVETVGIKMEYLNRWLKRSKYADFKDENLKVTVKLILDGFRRKKPMGEIERISGMKEDAIRRSVLLGQKGDEMFKPLSDFYESEILPAKLDKFLQANETKSVRKALESADLTKEEMLAYYELGKNGDERFEEFYREFFSIKKGTYVYHIDKGKSHKIAMRESFLTFEEYDECRDELEKLLRLIKFNIVLEALRNDKTSNVMASKAGCSVDDIYDWYFRGRDGEDGYVEFYEAFHKGYVKPNIVPIQEKLDSENVNIDNLIRSNKDIFTRKDFDIWLKHGLIKIGVVHLDKDDEDEDDDDEKKTKKIHLNISGPKSSRTSLGRKKSEISEEELKRQILGN